MRLINGSARTTWLRGLFPNFRPTVDTDYIISAVLALQDGPSAGKRTQPKQVLRFTVTASSRRDELLQRLLSFRAEYMTCNEEQRVARADAERRAGRQLQPNDTAANVRQWIGEKEVEGARYERQLEELRPLSFQGLMPAVTEHAWAEPGIFGLVGEFFWVDDPELGGPLSHLLSRSLGEVLTHNRAAVNELKRLHGERKIRRGIASKEIVRFGRYHEPGSLPHTQRGQRKTEEPAKIAYFNELVNGRPRIFRLVDVIRFDAGLGAQLGIDPRVGSHLLQELVGNKLVVSRRDDALEYSRLCYHSPIFCLDTWETESQGKAEQIGGGSSAGGGRVPRGGGPSLFLDPQRHARLQTRHDAIKQLRNLSNMLESVVALETKVDALEQKHAEVPGQLGLHKELVALELKCVQSGQRSKQADIDDLKRFLDALSGAGGRASRKRPLEGARS